MPDQSAPFAARAGEVLRERWGNGGPGSVSWSTLVSSDRTPSDSLAVGIAEIAAGDPDRLFVHRHEPAEVYYVTAGRGTVVVEGQTFPVKAGSTVFIPGGAWHSACNTGDEPLRLLYTFAVDDFSDVVYEFRDGDPTGWA